MLFTVASFPHQYVFDDNAVLVLQPFYCYWTVFQKSKYTTISSLMLPIDLWFFFFFLNFKLLKTMLDECWHTSYFVDRRLSFLFSKQLEMELELYLFNFMRTLTSFWSGCTISCFCEKCVLSIISCSTLLPTWYCFFLLFLTNLYM